MNADGVPAAPRGSQGMALAGAGLSSAAGLAFEIVLTRVFAVAQFHHFAFMTVSLAMLGLGASGSLLAASPRLAWAAGRNLPALALGQAAATLGAYALVNALPFDSFSIAWDARQLAYLLLIYIALSIPFLFGGLLAGALLSAGEAGQADRPPAHRVYAANLAGSGAGGALALGGTALFGGPGAVALAAVLAAAAAAAFAWGAPRRRSAMLAGCAALAVASAWAMLAAPAPLALRLSPYKDLSAALRYPGARIVETRWNAASRVDLVESAGIRSLPGLSFAYRGGLPPQAGLAFDGDDLSPVPLAPPDGAPFARFMLSALPYRLRPDGNALILAPRGGLEALVALANTTGRVLVVEPNELAIDLAERAGGGDAVYRHPRLRVAVDEPRAYVARDEQQYDLVILPLTAPYRPVTSGAYSLGEDYALTVEAFEGYLARLKPGGLLAVMRWLQTPPSEELRAIALAAAAARMQGIDPAAAVVALRSYANALILVRRPDPAAPGFTPGELTAIRRFADELRFDLLAAPGLRADETNRYNVLPDETVSRLAAGLLGAREADALIAEYPFDIAPPTDDRPYFNHYFRWSQAPDTLSSLGKTWQPFGGAGAFVLLLLLALAALAAGALILAPLAAGRVRAPARGRATAGDRAWTVAYFGLLGIAFLFVEIPLAQQVILLVGRPSTALAVVLCALLVGSGLGSLASPRMPWRLAALALTAAAAASPSLLRALSGAVLAAPLEGRIAAAAAVLLPLGFLMGILFPRGLHHLRAGMPGWVPWAWGINGAASVVSAVAAALLALAFGFLAVIAAGAACYGICALLVKGTNRTSPRL